jgi:hypothetical protein
MRRAAKSDAGTDGGWSWSGEFSRQPIFPGDEASYQLPFIWAV